VKIWVTIFLHNRQEITQLSDAPLAVQASGSATDPVLEPVAGLRAPFSSLGDTAVAAGFQRMERIGNAGLIS
jgi:hypothetical protein